MIATRSPGTTSRAMRPAATRRARVGEFAVGQAIGRRHASSRSKLKWTRSRCCAACQSSASARVAASAAGATGASGRARLRNIGRSFTRARSLEGARHVRDRLRFAHGLDRKPDPESALDAQDQFRCGRGCRSRDRDRAGWTAQRRRRAPAAPELLEQPADDLDELAASRELAGGFRVGRGRGGVHAMTLTAPMRGALTRIMRDRGDRPWAALDCAPSVRHCRLAGLSNSLAAPTAP